MEKKPVIICYPMAGDSLGGSHHSLLGLLDGLDTRTFEPLIVLEEPNGRLAEHFRRFKQAADPAPPRNSFAVGRGFSLTSFASTFAGLRKRVEFLRKSGAAIVHTNDGRTHATWALAAKLAGCKLLWHHRADPQAKGLRYLAPWVAHQIVTVSKFSLPPAKQTKAARQAQVVFSPFETDVHVDRQAMRQRLLQELNLPDDAVICGYFGSYIDRKRPLAFIEAIARLRTMMQRPVAGVMFGETTYPELEARMRNRMADADLAGSVHLMGYRSPGAEWIAGCDILLVPAIDEPLGRTLVEAMLVQTPVVATRSGGNPEAILDGIGIIIPPEDPEAMAAACLRIIDDPEGTVQMTGRAQSSARQRFSKETHVDAITRIYRQLSNRNQ